MNRFILIAMMALLSAFFVSGCFKTVPEGTTLTPEEVVVVESHTAKLAQAHLELNKALRLYWNAVNDGATPRVVSVEQDLKLAYELLEDADKLVASGIYEVPDVENKTLQSLYLAQRVLELMGL